jgi:hypothetical protein
MKQGAASLICQRGAPTDSDIKEICGFTRDLAIIAFRQMSTEGACSTVNRIIADGAVMATTNGPLAHHSTYIC